MPERLIENGQNLSQKEVSDLIAKELAQQEKESIDDMINEELKRSGNTQINAQDNKSAAAGDDKTQADTDGDFDDY